MSFDPDLTACAALVEQADPDRFLAAMAAPVAARRVLFPLYALNVEVSRAPWVTQEPMIAEMRLQWWRDALEEIAEGKTVRRHQVVTPLAEVLSPDLAAYLDQYVSVRRWDIYKDPFEDEAHLDNYIDYSSGALMVAAAQSLGPADADVLRDYGYAVGVANWLVAVPELEARGRIPLLDGTASGVRQLAQSGLERLSKARRNRSAISKEARAALLAGWQAEALLKQAVAQPERVADGTLGQSEFRRRTGLMWQAATGRW
ncbi:squalene/phytoene synthase family protein [Ruegeria sp. 2205SS24-7]|uniref:squalene/phytoene synthase family protein n=1 Tax=Ruegeria discodermiae TaxID=3064389 RepID=UPI002740C38E|nr:squalene/phytoene synthase family protein [Ruegeria sp. 2205SS24-7]MDP5216365.1 squalene/phytoene synthase family protein [Ruegeria sp. 2205SS24-7]